MRVNAWSAAVGTNSLTKAPCPSPALYIARDLVDPLVDALKVLVVEHFSLVLARRERACSGSNSRELGGAAKVARRLRQALSTGSSPQQMSKVRHERTCGRAIHVERGHGGCPSIPCRVGAWGQRPALADAAADRGRQRLRPAAREPSPPNRARAAFSR